MEEALRESEAKFRTLFDLANDAIFMLHNGVYVDCNAKGQEMYGRTREQIIGHTPDEFAPPTQPDGRNSRDKASEIIRNVLAGETQFFEWMSNLPNGTPLYSEISLNRLELVGKIYIQAIMRDITERKRAEENNVRSLALLRATLDSTADGILTIGPDRQILSFNETFVKMWRIPADILATNDDDLAIQCVLNQLQTPEHFLAKVRYLYDHPLEESFDVLNFKDGRVFERFSRPMLVEGHPLGRVWSFRDITERKHAEEKIAEQAAFLDQARDAIVVRDLNGAILFWNKGAERIYGWTREEAMGRHIGQLIYPDLGKFEAVNRLFLNQGEWSGELQHVAKDRRELTIEARWTLVRDKDGHPKSALAINTDITEKKKIEVQFMRAQRMESIGTLAGGIAHDLNNILAPIMMSIEILKQTATNPQAKSILESIAASSRRGADIVRQVLSFARGLEGERIEVPPNDLLKDIETFIKDTFPKNIRLELSLPDESWNILGDPTQLHQILLNLCLNARDAMPNGGRLTITVENALLEKQSPAMHLQAKAGRYAIINVTDSGTGIPPTILDKVFEPFFTTKEVGKGTGLGLSTVIAIVKSHDGFVNVYSEPGKGTTFKVYFPAMEASSATRKDVAILPSLPRGNGETVLIVDDEASVLAVTSQTLSAFGYRTLTANNGAEAVAIYTQHRDEISAVLSDMVMPIMDGPATIRALRKTNPSIKIIVASGSATCGSATKESDGEIKYFLNKPYTAGTLLKTLRTMLDEDAGCL
jgi:PAS domain S-box-containing protein